MYCKYCGRLIKETDKFCTNCGKSTGKGRDTHPKSKHELQNFLFSEGLMYDGEKFATNQENALEQIEEYITIGKVSIGEPPETRTQHLLLKRQLL